MLAFRPGESAHHKYLFLFFEILLLQNLPDRFDLNFRISIRMLTLFVLEIHQEPVYIKHYLLIHTFRVHYFTFKNLKLDLNKYLSKSWSFKEFFNIIFCHDFMGNFYL